MATITIDKRGINHQLRRMHMLQRGAPCTCKACVKIAMDSVSWWNSIIWPSHIDRRNRTADDAPDAQHGVVVREIAEGLSQRLGIALDDVLRVLLTYGRRSPPNEYADAIMLIAHEALRHLPPTGALLNTIAKTTIIDYWRRWHIRQHVGLDSLADTSDGLREWRTSIANDVASWESTLPVEIRDELHAGREAEHDRLTKRIDTAETFQLTKAFEASLEWHLVDERIDSESGNSAAHTLLDMIPQRIKDIGQRRLNGESLTATERQRLSRFLKSDAAHRVLTYEPATT